MHGLYQGLSGGGNTGHFNWQYQCDLDRTKKRIAELQALERMVEEQQAPTTRCCTTEACQSLVPLHRGFDDLFAAGL